MKNVQIIFSAKELLTRSSPSGLPRLTSNRFETGLVPLHCLHFFDNAIAVETSDVLLEARFVADILRVDTKVPNARQK